jgi:hypothetical protein
MTEPPGRAFRAPLDGIFPSSDDLGPTPLIGVPDTLEVLTSLPWNIPSLLFGSLSSTDLGARHQPHGHS